MRKNTEKRIVAHLERGLQRARWGDCRCSETWQLCWRIIWLTPVETGSPSQLLISRIVTMKCCLNFQWPLILCSSCFRGLEMQSPKSRRQLWVILRIWEGLITPLLKEASKILELLRVHLLFCSQGVLFLKTSRWMKLMWQHWMRFRPVVSKAEKSSAQKQLNIQHLMKVIANRVAKWQNVGITISYDGRPASLDNLHLQDIWMCEK